MTFVAKRLSAVVLPTMSFKQRTQAFVRFEEAIYKGKPLKDAKGNEQGAADLATITDLETGEQYTLICPTLLTSALTENDVEYVGQCYEIDVSKNAKEGKRYKEVKVYLIEDPASAKTKK